MGLVVFLEWWVFLFLKTLRNCLINCVTFIAPVSLRVVRCCWIAAMPTYTGCRRLWRGTGTQESPTPAIGSWFKSAGISIVQAVSWPANLTIVADLSFFWVEMLVYLVFIGNLCNMSVSFWANNFTISPDLTISESKLILNNKIEGDRWICLNIWRGDLLVLVSFVYPDGTSWL